MPKTLWTTAVARAASRQVGSRSECPTMRDNRCAVSAAGRRRRSRHRAGARRRAAPRGGQTQFIEQPVPRAGRGDPMGGVLEHALAHLDDPALAHRAHMSRRTFDRQFRHAVMRPTAARR